MKENNQKLVSSNSKTNIKVVNFNDDKASQFYNYSTGLTSGTEVELPPEPMNSDYYFVNPNIDWLNKDVS